MSTDSFSGQTKFKPYVPADDQRAEFTARALILGTILGLVFSASSLYLVLKVGMTVSASIPVAVLAITFFRIFSRFTGGPATILENNIVQTAGSAGESIAFGVGVTMPALLLLGFQMDLARVMTVSLLGGLLGILAMIPLRRAFIVRMHGTPGKPGTLLYPEGTACAQVLISGEKGGSTGFTVFMGFGIALLHKFLTEGLMVLMGTFKFPLVFINRAAVFSSDMASELLGVGYIIGLRTSAIMMGGALLGYLVILPLIAFAGDAGGAIVPPGRKPIHDMSITELRNNYLLYIGAGCVATAGIISMIRTLPLILRSLTGGLRRRKGQTEEESTTPDRTENDLPMVAVLGGSLVLLGLLTAFLAGEVGWSSAVAGGAMVIVFGFLFVTVSSRLTGEIGSSSNPISGMTVATLMITCLIFLGLGWTSSKERVLALSIAAVVCVAASNGGTTAQSLKTGFLVGGTPRFMQYAILIGALISGLVIGGTLLQFNNAGTVYSEKMLPVLTLSDQEMALLVDKETHKEKDYLIFDTRNDLLTRTATPARKAELEAIAKDKPGAYLVGVTTKKIEILKDPGIMGVLENRDDGSRVNREFAAPKTQVMGIIINGVLKRDLNWSMVAMGAIIALVLDMCGVSALAFAVGIYVPIAVSAPIFAGGLVRAGVDHFVTRRARAILANAQTEEEKAAAELEILKQTETSPGVLLASGYIAGGSIAGVVLAFFAFSDTLPKDLAQWQYPTWTAPHAGSLAKLAEEAAKERLGKDATPEELKAEIQRVVDLNEEEGIPARLITVPVGTKIFDLSGKENEVKEATTLGQLARTLAGREYLAGNLFKVNTDKGIKLTKMETIPAGTTLLMPQPAWPALVAFGGLALLLCLVGWGYLIPGGKTQS
ncbi:MAG: oligopeptide transporter, OPT family [Planctomycetota bacterium]|nr:oligopeptide transporter, OPT family [Planctomycetota bacterium]